MIYIIFTLLHNLLDFRQVNLFKTAKHWDSFFTHCRCLRSALLRARTRAAVPGMAALLQKRCRAQPIVHALADLATSQSWPHWTTGGYPGFSKAADACGTLGEAKESCTELFRGLCTERGKGELLFLAGVSVCSYRVY